MCTNIECLCANERLIFYFSLHFGMHPFNTLGEADVEPCLKSILAFVGVNLVSLLSFCIFSLYSWFILIPT